jgi:Stress-induced bacterial acidophilic repeat motif.
MSGTKEGGRKAAATNKKRNGEDFFKRIGAIGGRNGHTGGFASSHELAVEAGRKGGRISKRGKAKKDENEDF